MQNSRRPGALYDMDMEGSEDDMHRQIRMEE